MFYLWIYTPLKSRSKSTNQTKPKELSARVRKESARVRKESARVRKESTRIQEEYKDLLNIKAIEKYSYWIRWYHHPSPAQALYSRIISWGLPQLWGTSRLHQPQLLNTAALYKERSRQGLLSSWAPSKPLESPPKPTVELGSSREQLLSSCQEDQG